MSRTVPESSRRARGAPTEPDVAAAKLILRMLGDVRVAAALDIVSARREAKRRSRGSEEVSRDDVLRERLGPEEARATLQLGLPLLYRAGGKTTVTALRQAAGVTWRTRPKVHAYSGRDKKGKPELRVAVFERSGLLVEGVLPRVRELRRKRRGGPTEEKYLDELLTKPPDPRPRSR